MVAIDIAILEGFENLDILNTLNVPLYTLPTLVYGGAHRLITLLRGGEGFSAGSNTVVDLVSGERTSAFIKLRFYHLDGAYGQTSSKLEAGHLGYLRTLEAGDMVKGRGSSLRDRPHNYIVQC
jgi:hypothetical protein